MSSPNLDAPEAPEPAPRGRILRATGLALLVAGLVLVLAVLPAEYGVDPTGFGDWAGLSALSGATATPGGSGDEHPADGSAGLVQQGRLVQGYDARWPIGTTDLGTFEGYTPEGTTSNLSLPVEVENLTALTATLTWTDRNTTAGQPTAPDLFEVRIVAPDGRMGAAVLGRNEVGAAGTVAATFRWGPVPGPQSTEAATEGEARAEFATVQPADRSSHGEWRVLVTLIEAGDGTANGVPLPSGPGPAGDSGNTWSLSVRAEAYALEVSARPGVGLRRDTVVLTLAPGADVEYKLAVRENASLDYAWSTDGAPVFFDFHGDRDSERGFLRHKAGTASADAATFRAPFDGRHGWYWRNSGETAVTLTLDLRGAYTVIGRV